MAAEVVGATPEEQSPPLTGSDEEALREAVQAYSDAFLGGDADAAHAQFSGRCRERTEPGFFASLVEAGQGLYGAALPLRTYDAEVFGDLARVSYTYDVPALDQTGEPWAKEGGVWRQDDC